MRNSAYVIVGVIVVILLIIAAWMYSRSPSPSGSTANVSTGIFDYSTGTRGTSGQGTTSTSSEEFVEPNSGVSYPATGSGVTSGAVSSVETAGFRFPKALFTRTQIISLTPQIVTALEGLSNQIRKVQTVIENDNKAIDNTIADLRAQTDYLQSVVGGRATSTATSSIDVGRVTTALQNAQDTVNQVLSHRQMINGGVQALTAILQEAAHQISIAP
jgi:hypothetical protein